jgi:hypothetical protein
LASESTVAAQMAACMGRLSVSPADMAARDHGSVAPWESARNSWEAVGSRGKKRYDVR